MGILIDEDVKENADEAVNKIKKLNTGLYNFIVVQHTAGFNFIWHNKKFSAKEIIDGFGKDAVALFQLSSAIQQMLITVNPEYVPLIPPKQYTINADGTVTIIE
jgi:hypothetical protein